MRTLIFILFYMILSALNIKSEFQTPWFMTIFTLLFAVLDFTEPNRRMQVVNYFYNTRNIEEKL